MMEGGLGDRDDYIDRCGVCAMDPIYYCYVRGRVFGCHRSSVEGTHTTGWVDVQTTIEHRKTLLKEQALRM